MKVVLLPNLLGNDASIDAAFPPHLKDVMLTLNGVIAGDEKTAREYVRFFGEESLKELPISLLTDQTSKEEVLELLQPVANGENWGLISCARGEIILEAHRMNLPVETVVGPSAIFMALQLSGLGSEKFSVHGPFPKAEEQLISWLHTHRRKGGTHLFTEHPARNTERFEQLLRHLTEETLLSVATDLSLPTEQVLTMSVLEWKQHATPDIKNRPTLFLLEFKSAQ